MGVVDGLRRLFGFAFPVALPDGPPGDKVVAQAPRPPRHVAIIMDGNRRWAADRGLPALAGHREGTRALRRAVQAAVRCGLEQLTVFAFSTENWGRPEGEVSGLMSLFAETLTDEIGELHEQGVRVVFIGRPAARNPELQASVEQAMALTAQNTRMTLYVAFNYGGRAEMVDAVRGVVAAGIPASAVDDDVVRRHLYAPEMLDPDLVIRTSGEIRLSNFLLWQTAYSEFYFTDQYWPDFNEDTLQAALADYAARERRFGLREDRIA